MSLTLSALTRLSHCIIIFAKIYALIRNQKVYQLIHIFHVTYVLLTFLVKSNMPVHIMSFTVLHHWCLNLYKGIKIKSCQ